MNVVNGNSFSWKGSPGETCFSGTVGKRKFVSQGKCFSEKKLWLSMATCGFPKMSGCFGSRTEQIVATKMKNNEEAGWEI
jgi:hypothetical protein